MSDDEDKHAKDLEFMRWVQDPGTLSADLRAKWHELYDIGWLPDLWKSRLIERELERRGEVEPL